MYSVLMFQVKTRSIDNNGFNPIWDETVEFEVNVPGVLPCVLASVLTCRQS